MGGSPPLGTFGVACSLKEESGISAAEATLGQQLVLPGQAHMPQVEDLPAAHVPPAVILATRRSYADCRGGSFTCFSSRHHGLGVCAAGRLWPAIIRQLSGPLPRAGERTGDFPAPAGRAGGLRVKGLFEAAPSSQAPGACLQAAKGVPTPRRHWCHV